VRRIEAALGADCDVKSPDWLMDRITKRKREVDVAVRRKVGSQILLIINECRDHKRKVDARYVEATNTKRDDVRANKAVIISRAGFSDGAITKANHYGIGLMTVKEAEEANWREWIAADVFEVRNLVCSAINIKVVLGNDDGGRRPDTMNGVTIRREDGTVVDQLPAVVMNAINEEPAARELIPETKARDVPFNIDVSAAKLRADFPGGSAQVLRLVGIGTFCYRVTRVPINHYEYVTAQGERTAEYADAVFDVPGKDGLQAKLVMVRTGEGIRVTAEPMTASKANGGTTKRPSTKRPRRSL